MEQRLVSWTRNRQLREEERALACSRLPSLIISAMNPATQALRLMSVPSLPCPPRQSYRPMSIDHRDRHCMLLTLLVCPVQGSTFYLACRRSLAAALSRVHLPTSFVIPSHHGYISSS
ncbi:uncharacterized protein LAESUDRAFT_283292 [Laetiporus sulphureus 93-53]|uniref:Uncharacterized protein n=1 Tax=Laetiporus sulphureus 93-53 TaxID=1314785 RepID=A0A165DFE9_9APHY|nr:uncharacterized protein LAESUDRAFT_283292 [Laetiporus sulphureus 93-53]KZT04775.1 hypothetical protein LAESUDRAFT_283292 [Laetiporus sulphureus 93-53]